MDSWVILAAIATSVSAIVIAWQAWETRKSAKASHDAVEIANNTLELARDEATRSRAMIEESVKARLDADAPHVRIELSKPDERQPYGFVTSNGYDPPKDLKPLGVGEQFHSPQHDETLVWLTLYVTFFNDSARRVELRLWPAAYPSYQIAKWTEPSSLLSLEGGESVTRVMLLGGSLSSWISNGDLDPKGDAYWHIWGQWTVAMNWNTGVVMNQRIEVWGSIFDPNGPGAWVLKGQNKHDYGSLIFRIRPSTKTYVLDRINGIEIPDVPPEVLKTYAPRASE